MNRLPMTETGQLPNISAVYFIFDGSGRVLYVGASRILRKRFSDHHRKQDLREHGAALSGPKAKGDHEEGKA